MKTWMFILALAFIYATGLTGLVIAWGESSDDDDNAVGMYHKAETDLKQISAQESPSESSSPKADPKQIERHYQEASDIYDGMLSENDPLTLWTQQLREEKDRAYLLQQELTEELARRDELKRQTVQNAVNLESQEMDPSTQATAADQVYQRYRDLEQFNAQQIAMLEKELALVRNEIGRLKRQIRTSYGEDPDRLVPDLPSEDAPTSTQISTSIVEKMVWKPSFGPTMELPRLVEAAIEKGSGTAASSSSPLLNAVYLKQLKDEELSKTFRQLVVPSTQAAVSIHETSLTEFERLSNQKPSYLQ